MVVDGRQIAHDLKRQLGKQFQGLSRRLSLAVIQTGDDFVTQKYISIKEAAAHELGVEFKLIQLEHRAKTEDVLRELLHAARRHDGVVVQMPLSHNVDVDAVRQIMPITHDVDVFGNTAFVQFQEKRLPILPPVVGAISEILKRHEITVAGKKVVVLGEGRLVGIPSAIWAERMGAFVQTLNRDTADIAASTKEADILILGAGAPGLITSDKIKDGVIIMDAGTTEASGKLKGDADPSCAEKAALITPVPGGIGPISIAKLFENLLVLTLKRSERR